MNAVILASIIQGEAAILGPIGMYAVAGCLTTQLDAGWLPYEIESAWYGREEPGSYALYLAEMIDAGRMPANGYLYCLSKQDIDKAAYDIGELVVSATGTPYQLHLFKEWPG